MNSKFLKFAIGCAVLLLLLLNLVSIPTVYADTDSNSPVSEWIKEGKNDQKSEKPASNIGNNESKKESNDVPVGSSAKDYVKTLFALLFVIGLLFTILKFVNGKNRMYNKTRLMKNLGGISLGQHKSIQLVVIGDSYYLIGVGEDIRLLKEITDPTEIEQLMQFYSDEDSTDLSSSGTLAQLLLKFKGFKKTQQNPSVNETTNFGTLFNSTLNEMKEERTKQINRLTEKERNRDE